MLPSFQRPLGSSLDQAADQRSAQDRSKVFSLLAVGDVMGRPGRQALASGLKLVKESRNVDFVIVNGENLAGGFGITKKIFLDLIENYGVDCVTTGNHWMDKREVYEFLDHPKLVVPMNMKNVDPKTQGSRVLQSETGHSVAVMNAIGRVFMKGDNEDPFLAVDRCMSNLPSRAKIRIMDFHAEATSEKQAMGHYLAGKVSVVYGTHSHVPTADERILSRHTGFVTDIGMTGPYDSVIGIDKNAAIHRMRTGERKNFEPAKDDCWFFACLFEIDVQNGQCISVERLRFPIERG